ncbi:hypothetical protein FOTG_15294 [Fusarium oxysporum f. sp. vasinfectum 25433]|uniref:Uncharacterized protein n=1 Tax=Fusarium oxysporum f. sp. vasinfectum 25433 TaxID=1089449 RepID=X0M6Z3_FUSOX|nr:hypothetical protein FOTG_15294 [Fusarium oxysporum f. sp. vasinfectum 25433]
MPAPLPVTLGPSSFSILERIDNTISGRGKRNRVQTSSFRRPLLLQQPEAVADRKLPLVRHLVHQEEAQSQEQDAGRHDRRDADPERRPRAPPPSNRPRRPLRPTRRPAVRSGPPTRSRSRTGTAIEARKVRPVLVLDPLEVRLAEEERSVQVEPRQADLAVGVAQGDVSVCNIPQARREVAELLPGDVRQDEAQAGVLGDAQVGLVLHEMVVRPQVAQRRSSNAFKSSPAGLCAEIVPPECVRRDVPRERLDEDAIVDPHEVELRVPRHDDGAPFHQLPVERRYVSTVLF